MGEVTMRTAAFSGYRSATARRPHTLPSAAAASSTVHEVTEGSPLISSISSERITAVQRPVWELDDWEFADAGLDLVEDLDPKPRLVFGPFPGAEKAEEATKDLKETMDNIYFSGIAEDNVKGSQVSDLGGSTAILLSMPKPAVQASTMLQGSPEAQSLFQKNLNPKL